MTETFREHGRIVQLSVTRSAASAAVATRSGLAVRSHGSLEARGGPAGGTDWPGRPTLPDPDRIRHELSRAPDSDAVTGWSFQVVERRRRIAIEGAPADTASPSTESGSMEQTVDETRHLLITLHGRDRSSGLQQRCRRAVIGDLEEWRFEWVGQLWETLVGALRRRAGAGRWRGPSDRTELSAVFAPGVGGTVVHEAVGHLFEADVTSGPRGMPGARIASDRLTVVDDATLPDLWGTRRIDDEGRTCRPLTLIHAGRFGELLHSRDTDPARSTSARRGSYTCAPLPRMSNTYLAAGSDRTEDLMDGPLVLHCLDGGAAEVRPGSGDVLVRIRFAQLLRGGIPVADHRDLLLQVAAADLMDRIEGVGPAVHFEAARCRKEGQSVPVAHGAPAFRLPVTVLR